MNKIKDQLQHCLSEFKISNFGEQYTGKVRDNFHFEDKIFMVTSDRESPLLIMSWGQSHLKDKF